ALVGIDLHARRRHDAREDEIDRLGQRLTAHQEFVVEAQDRRHWLRRNFLSSLPRRRSRSRNKTPRWHASVTYSSQCCAVAPGAIVSRPGTTGNARSNAGSEPA